MTTLNYNDNQPARRQLASMLMMMRESECIALGIKIDDNANFGNALMAVNAAFEQAVFDLDHYDERLCEVTEKLAHETDERQRVKLEFMWGFLNVLTSEMWAAKSKGV